MALGPVLAGLACLVAQAGPDLVVSTLPPVDAQRLSDALRTYFAGSGVRVETAPAAGDPAGRDLREEIAEARTLGENARAIAVVRAAHGPQGTIDIELVDFATDKVLLASIPRPPRDEDLYRALALKIQAILRATLSEAPERLDPGSGLGRIVSSSAPPLAVSAAPVDPPPAAPSRLLVQLGYGRFSFPLNGPAFDGLAIAAGFAPRPWLELGLATAALGTARQELADVVAVTRAVPVFAAARLRLERSRLDLLFGPGVGLVLIDVRVTSATSPVHSPRDLLVAVGPELEARWGLSRGAWLFARAAARLVIEGERYRVNGVTLFDTSRLAVDAGAGIAVRLW